MNKWPKLRIDSLGEVQGGRQRSPKATGSMRPYLRVANVFSGRIDVSDLLQMPFEDDEFKRFQLRSGDVLLNEGQSLELVGRSAIYNNEAYPCAFQNTLIRFRPYKIEDSSFAQAYFEHLRATGVFQSIATQTTSIAHLGVNRFASLEVVMPPVDVRLAIARIVREFQTAIELLNRLANEVSKRNAGLIRQLMDGQRRFPEFIKSKKRLCDGWLEHPIDWSLKAVSEFASETNKKAPTEDVPVLSSTKHEGLVDSLIYFGRRVYSDDISNYKLVLRGQFAYATNHIEEGSIGLLKHREAGLVSPMYTVFEIIGDALPSFLLTLFKSDRYVHRFGAMTNGSVDRRGGLRWTDFRMLKVAMPSLSEQTKIVELIELLNHEVKLLKRQRAALEKQKQGVMERLLSGEVAIHDDVIDRLNAEAEEEERVRAKDAKLTNTATKNAS